METDLKLPNDLLLLEEEVPVDERLMHMQSPKFAYLLHCKRCGKPIVKQRERDPWVCPWEPCRFESRDFIYERLVSDWSGVSK